MKRPVINELQRQLIRHNTTGGQAASLQIAILKFQRELGKTGFIKHFAIFTVLWVVAVLIAHFGFNLFNER